jgi:hypothetical protein
MRGIIWHKDNKGLALVTRSGSHCLFKVILETHHPSSIVFQNETDRWHPIRSIPTTNTIDIAQTPVPEQLTFAVIVRDPIERFRSACARLGKTPSEVIAGSLDNVHTWTLESMGLINHPQARYFLFPELEKCAIFLELPTPLEQVNEEPVKPDLTEEELQFATQHYAKDIEFYNSLQQN